MEELDIDTDNLCTTEDAFEQFQSGAMYEEDEFITLSDIVSSPHTNHDVNEILHDDPCDEVVSMSIQNEKTNNITIPSFEQNEVFDVNSQKKNQNNKNNKKKTRTPKRRGRKKKGGFENNDVQQTQSQIDFNKPTKPKRQSRKSITASDTSDLKYVEVYAIEEPKGAVPVTGKVNKPANKAKRKSRYSIPRKEVEEQIKKQGKQAKLTTKKLQNESLHEDKNSQIITSTMEDSNISTTTLTYDNKKIKHKRGRKKQNTSRQNSVLSDPEVPVKMCEIKSVIPLKTQNDELESSIPVMPLYDEINKGSEVNDKPNITNKKSLRNSVVSDSVKNDVSDEDIEDLPLSNLSKKTENELDKDVDTTTQNENMSCTTLENKNYSDSIIHSKNNTSNCREIIVKKRGRPKKIPDNSNAKSDLEVKKIENIKKVDNISDLSTQEKQNKCENPEIISEPVLFSDNESQIPNSCEIINTSTESNSQSKRNSKKKLIPDFEYNVDSVVKNDKTEDIPKLHEDYDEKLDTEDSSRRPVRRRVLKNWNYDEGSDEDPYANVESSDDEPRRRKKGGRCYSDDEYFPGDKRQLTESESDIAMDEDLGLNDRPQKKKKCRKSDLVISNKSSRKKGRKSDAESICTTEKTNTNTDSGDIDFEDCLESSIIRGNDTQITPTKSKRDSQSWGKTNEFENFIAKIAQGTDIKISKKSVDNVKASLQIPVIEATEVKKHIEKSVQTITVNTKPACVQTDTACEIPMKDQVPLTGEQSEKACDFLSSIVQTTAELGQLMTQKSEDFITKKINTKYVTDTFKMDYCVKKSFLLFKLAKHNLVQMEEDLSKQYEEFLRENNLIQHRQEQKIIASTSKASDSDCEIVEEPVKKNILPKAQKPAFNPKTVFLNKELSIKIAKKPTEEPAPKKKLNIQGSHSVWINDSILVKKVKPNQSFLAQDSRNKKPPDNEITLESVNNFFKMYERQKALFICAPFIKTEWFGRERKYMCNYFVDSTTDFPEKTVVRQNENVVSEVAFGEHDSNHGIGRSKPEEAIELGPETLSLLCTKILQNCLHSKQLYTDRISNKNDINQWEPVRTNSQSLPNIGVEDKHYLISDINKNIIHLKPNYNALIYVQPLKTLCFKRVIKLISNAHFSDGKPKLTSENLNACIAAFHENDTNNIKMKYNTSYVKQIKPLLSLCVKAIQKTQKTHLPPNINNIKYMPKSLKSISLFKVQTVINENINSNNTSLEQNSCNGESLIQLCVDATNISSYGNSNSNNTTLEPKKNNVKTLLQLCIDTTNISSYGNSIINNTSLEQKYYNVKSLLQLCIDTTNMSSYGNSIINNTSLKQKYYNVKSLLQLCIAVPNMSLCINNANSLVDDEPLFLEQKKSQIHSVLTLKSICCKKITELSKPQYILHEIQSERSTLNFTINNVNTVSDDVFLEVASDNDQNDVDIDNYVESSYNEEEQNNYSDVDSGTNYDDLGEDDNNWVSQVQMQELRSCLNTIRDMEMEDEISDINENERQDTNVQIKLESNEYLPESVDSSNIKTEPGDDHEYMGESNHYSSINMITKQEDIIEAQVRKEPLCRQNSNSYDENFFESFVSANKMIAALNDYGSTSDEIFSQSSQRVRRQHEPDPEDDFDVLTDTMNLLVPQNDESKNRLMESSEEEDDGKEYKKTDKKKPEKRKCKSKNNKDLPNKGKMLQKNEVTVLTKKMKDKIRQEHDKSESSDSEPDCLKLRLKIDKEKTKENESNNESNTKRKEEEKVIQCNDVDSTELITENKSYPSLQNNNKNGYPDEDNSESITDDRSLSPLIDSNVPVEVVECEPTLPIFDEFLNKKPELKKNIKKIDTSDTTSYVEHAWKCYPIDREDSKIYAHAYVLLDKLPASFIETYFKYQDVMDKTTEDIEIDKLTNLQSLQSTISKKVNNLSKTKPKIIEEKTKVPDNLEVIESNEQQLKEENSPFPQEEFSASEDESPSNVDKYIPSAPVQSNENKFAKKLLMNDSDTEKADVEAESTVMNIEKTYKTRSGRTVKCKVEKAELEKDDIILTADKMMNKELALLHAPVDIKAEDDSKNNINKSNNKNVQKNVKGQTTRYEIKTEDDSSSEEEKQWFTTKEKLLKRLLKKNEDTNVADAKRAKIVSEFIEKRGERPETRQRLRTRTRSKKTVLERRKQIKLLSRELFGVDTVYSKKYSPANTSNGRRNIRKVIDKKSLARSTVLANMEEFERKRRLTLSQAQLREDLGCEEGVNVVVINDELCLEYDFEKKRPIVSVHQFFTKVMKAHQYEGVKFMWDACFESVSRSGSGGGGGGGGGCILAHCMGLGKTLQVLALLHTVLTHPELGMRRVLVCCPLSTVLNWVDEINKWIGPVTNHIKVFELSKLKKTYERAYQLEDWYNGGGIFIIGYELFRSLSTLDPVFDCIRPTIVNKIRTALLDPGPDIIVCDEGHLLKNDCSVLAVAMSRVVTKRRIILTGTPMQNNLREYYCMVNFVKPNLLGSYSEYSNRFENPIMNGQHRDSREEDIKLMKARTHILHKVLEGCLQRQEASVLYPYLPKKYEYTVFISLTKCQWELYKHYLTHYINTKENKQSVLRDFHVLQKIWTHPLVLNNFLMNTSHDEREPKLKAEKLDEECEEAEQAAPAAAAWWARTDHRYVLDQLHSSYKFLVVFQLLHECVELGDKVLIFSTSLYAMDALEFFLKRENKWTLGREYYRLDGSVPAEVRQKWCREFNAPQNTATKLFLISTRAGSLGLNMTAANRVIILDTSWNPAHDIQSIFRVYRFGQKKDCYIYRLVAMGTMEQKIYERSVTKQAVACRVVDEQQIDRHYNMAELSELYRLDEAGSGVSAGLAAGVRDAALLRVAAAAAEGGGLHAVHEHDSLLRGSSESVLPEHERNAAWMQFQQEHATTHIRNFEINVPKQSIEDTDVRPKTDNIELKKENECETDTDNTTPKVIKKSKRKSKTKNIEPEPQPSTSQQDLNPEVEESMIKKIMNILIKHNFHKTKRPEEISALVMNVRDVVARAPKQSLNDADTLTESIARVLLKSEHITIPEDEIESEDDTDLLEMNLLQRKRRKNRNDSDEEYLPNTRKRKSTANTNTKKSNESVSSDNNYAALDSDTETTNIISNKQVLEKESVVISLNTLETLSKEPSESNHIIKIDERSCKKSNKKVKIHKNDVKKETQRSYVYETVENESLKESSTNVSNTDILDEERVVIKIKKSKTLSKKPSETKQNEVKIDVSASKQSNEKVKTIKNDVEKEKQPNYVYETLEPLNESTEIIAGKELLEKEPVVITLKKPETLSKKPSESSHIVKIDESASQQCNKKVKKDVPKEKQPSNIYKTVEDESSNECIEVNDNSDIHFSKEEAPVQPTENESKTKNIEPEPQPSTSQQDLNPEVEESMIKKIMNILIKHNFHKTKRPEEISALVMNVRDVVARAPKQSLNDADTLTESIARVLLKSEHITIPEDEIESEDDTDLIEMNLHQRKRRKNRNDSDEEYLSNTRKRKSTDNTNTKKSNESVNSDNNYAALDSDTETTNIISNKEVFEKESVVISLNKSETLSKEPSASNHIIKIDERSCKKSNKKVKIHKNDSKKGKQQSYIYETEENDTLNESTEQNVPKEKQPSNIYKTVENESSNEFIEVNDNSDIHFFTDEAPVQPTENESICLSDDDEPIITDPATQVKKDISKIGVVEKIEKDETIPLHKSVLTNKNFIKLVAHTYLSGNPMLDEDAALLAAQYSTLKALKEVQATGKNLTSGPIHDIAVKVLGRALMKRLLLANPNKNTAETMLLETENLQNKTMNDMLLENSKLQKPVIMDDNKKLEPETKTMYKRKIDILRKTNMDSEGLQSTTKSYQGTISVEATNTKVVPVGIFKGPVALPNQQPSLEECILPDDDEVIIAAAPTPSPAGTQVARRNSKQLVINTVSSKESCGREQSIAYVQDLVPIPCVTVASGSTAQSTTNNIKPAKASLPNTTDNSSRNQNFTKLKKGSKSEVKTAANINKNTTPASDVTYICLDSDEEDIPSYVICKKNTEPVISSDSRTLLVTPLVKNHGKNCSEIDNKKILVPVTSVSTSSSSTLVNANKTRTASVDQRKKLVKEISSPKVNERKCKPGDIIRINESGKVEILKRITDAELSTQIQATKLKDDDRSENNSKKVNPLPLTDRFSKEKLAKNVSDKVSILKQDKRKEIPSTSKQQKDPDPLSVLRNIIHIPAFKYEKTSAPKPPVEKTLQTCLPSAKEVTANTKLSSSKLLEVKPVITFKGRQQVIITKDKQTIVKKKIISTKSTSAIKTNDVPKTKIPASKDFVIDLTSSKQVQIKKASVPASSKEVIVVAGSSKDTGTNKVSSVVSDPKKSTVATIGKTLSKVSSKSSSSSTAVPSTSESKRSSPWSEGAQSKKQKTESKKKLSLKDFNLDDFDDIIELE